MNVYSLPPERHAELAREAEAKQDWKAARQHWLNAKQTSAGHNRRCRYDAHAEECAAKIKD